MKENYKIEELLSLLYEETRVSLSHLKMSCDKDGIHWEARIATWGDDFYVTAKTLNNILAKMKDLIIRHHPQTKLARKLKESAIPCHYCGYFTLSRDKLDDKPICFQCLEEGV